MIVYILELKIYVDVFVFLLSHMYRRHLSPPVRKMCPVLDVPLMGENIIFVSLNVSSAHVRKYTHIIKCSVNMWHQGKNLQDLSGQNPC